MHASAKCTYGNAPYELIIGPTKDKCVCLVPHCRFKTKNHANSDSACREVERHIDEYHEPCKEDCGDPSMSGSEYCVRHGVSPAMSRRRRADDDGPMYHDTGEVDRIFL